MVYMNTAPTREKIADGVYFTHIKDAKFKHNRISINFIVPLDKKTVTQNAVLPLVLRRSCASCPDFTQLNIKLNSLYGANLDSGVTKYNGFQILRLSISAVDNRFALEGEDIIAECAKLLCDIATEPRLDKDGRFYAEDLEPEKQYLIDTIEAKINDKRSYAKARCIEAMCGEEPVSIDCYGYVQEAEKITAESAALAWRSIISTAGVEILFTGPGNHEAGRDLFAGKFLSLSRNPVSCSLFTLKDSASCVNEVTETIDVQQAKLVMGMRVGGLKTQNDITAARIFSAMYGVTPFSKLFMNVREKLSLCYYCSSQFDVSNKLLFVESGVEQQNKEKAIAEIMLQLKEICSGNFTPDELENTKLLVKNSILSANDSLSAMEAWYLTRSLQGLSLTPEQDCANVDSVTAQNVIDIANAVTLDTIYFLTGINQPQVDGEDENSENEDNEDNKEL